VRRLASWIAPIAWMALVFWFSTEAFDARMTGSIVLPLVEWLWPWPGSGVGVLLHAALRKLAHLTEYGILAFLWWRALAPDRGRPRWGAVGLAFGITVVWAALDELHQSTLASRTGSAADVVLDASGAGIALTASGWARGSLLRGAGIVLATAALGGGLFLTLHYGLGLGVRWLWAVVPAAWLVITLALQFRSSRPGLAAFGPGS
jgi:VanZ family protein